MNSFTSKICFYPDKYSSWWRTSWRRLSSSWRRLDQDKYVRLSLISSEDVFKTSSEDVFMTSSRRFDQDQYIRIGHPSSRHNQDVFKTSLRRLAKTSSRHLQDAFKTSCKDIFVTFSRSIINLTCSCFREVFNTFLRRSFRKMVIYRGICLGNTTSEKFMVSVQNLQ